MESMVMGAHNPNRSFWAGRSVLVTGHTGFKGAWLSLWLSRLGARVHGFALAPDTGQSLFTQAKVQNITSSHIGDVRDIDALRQCFCEAKPEIVLHLAAQSLVRPSYVDPVGTYGTNVMGTVHLLEATRSTPSVRAVVVVTSDKAYENREWLWAYREDEPMGGRDPYSNSKGCTELVTSAYRASFFDVSGHGARVGSVRAGNVIGGGDWSADRLIPDVIRAFSQSSTAKIRAPNAVRPWQHVLEPLVGYLRLAELMCGPNGEQFAEAWNFGPADEDCRPVSEMVSVLATEWGEGASWQHASADHLHEATLLKVDASKARARLGWDRRLGLIEALAWTAAWYRAQAKGADAAALCHEQIGRFEELGRDEG